MWSPASEAGTAIEVLKPPVELEVRPGVEMIVESKVIVIVEEGAKPEPETTIELPTAPLFGLKAMLGKTINEKTEN